MAEIKKRYSDEELDEFRVIIEEKLAVARENYKQLMSILRNDDGNDVADTSPTYKILEEGSITQTKTGELIPKERLRIVPHATLSVESKNARKK